MNQFNQLVSLMDIKEQAIQKLFTQLDEATDPLEDKDISDKDKFKVSLCTEYLLLKIRIAVSRELDNIYSMNTNLYSLDIPDSIKITVKARERQLISTLGRLTELREDLNSLQKVMYTYNQLP